jgi:aminopeptidase N
MNAAAPVSILLKDYKPAPYHIKSLELDIALDPLATRVTSRMVVQPNPASTEKSAPLVFDGEVINLVSVSIDGVALSTNQFAISETKLIVPVVPQTEFILSIVVTCAPAQNTALSGLYMSNGMYCTQCEAEGFRRITYFYDRPDAMTVFKVRVEAPLHMPVLLCNGNLVEKGVISDRQFAVWHDPHPKPSYLFALVAGDLASVHDTFTTMNGDVVDLGIYVEKGKEDRCAWAMESLKASMIWDEEKFGRAYDLGVFNIVAVSDFNMGAMENKGLNIFNDKYILALPETATDSDYTSIEAIIAHEYFHNWTGNRITCRDWFQLCLKEGLTVFRDQEFTSDLRSRAVKRIQDVKTLRARQFPEDQGPLSHPVRPSSYIEINNFYTPTIYEKGAEICRMMKTLIGAEKFRTAMDLYFKRHDGEAATVENFVACMADASGRDFTQFFRWYEQAGTPILSVHGSYDEAEKIYDLRVSQSTPRLEHESEKLPYHMPIALGLVGAHGKDLLLDLEGKGHLAGGVLEITKTEHIFRFKNVGERPRLSINRGFTAPIILKTDQTAEDLLFLMGHDSDNFNRWEAAQTVGKLLIGETYEAIKAGSQMPNCDGFAAALGQTLLDPLADESFKALMFTLPSAAEIAIFIAKDVDSDLVHQARQFVMTKIATHLRHEIHSAFELTNDHEEYRPDVSSTSRRALRYVLLNFIAASDPENAGQMACSEWNAARDMTSETGAISAILGCDTHERKSLLESFHAKHRDDPLILDKWLAMCASIPGADASMRVARLLDHADFKITTPNRVYALIGSFNANMTGFHADDGSGYKLLADVIIKLNTINPQVAARMATGFRSWALYDQQRRLHATEHMKRILATPALSSDVFEIISRTLKN